MENLGIVNLAGSLASLSARTTKHIARTFVRRSEFDAAVQSVQTTLSNMASGVVGQTFSTLSASDEVRNPVGSVSEGTTVAALRNKSLDTIIAEILDIGPVTVLTTFTVTRGDGSIETFSVHSHKRYATVPNLAYEDLVTYTDMQATHMSVPAFGNSAKSSITAAPTWKLSDDFLPMATDSVTLYF